jgi:cobalt/nickel transport system permease protein
VLVLVVAVALMPRRPDALYWLPTALLAVAWAWTRMPLRHAWTRLVVVEPFVLAIALLSLLRPESAPVFFAAIIKSNLCLVAMLLLTFATPFPELLQVLRRCRVPAAMLTILALMVRYLPVLAEESRRMQRARASRSFTRKRRLTWVSLGAVAGQLFGRTADRAERLYLAMCARGWRD